MLRVSTAVVAVALAVAGCGSAPVCTVAEAPRSAFLWQVTSAKHPAATVWLFGTIHNAGDIDIPDVAWHKLRGSPVLIVEIDDVSTEQFDRAIRLPPGQSLMK